MNQVNDMGTSSRSQSNQFNADEFTAFLVNLPFSIDHLEDEYGKPYPPGVQESYKRFVSFLKKHQDQLKLAVDKDQLHEILSDIFEKEDTIRLAQDVNAFTNHLQIESIFKSNSLSDAIRIYLRNFYRSSRSMNDSHRKKLKTFYEENKQLLDHLCNLYLLFSYKSSKR